MFTYVIVMVADLELNFVKYEYQKHRIGLRRDRGSCLMFTPSHHPGSVFTCNAKKNRRYGLTI